MLAKKAFLGGVLLLAGCRTATQVTVELVTDVACDTKPSTAARVGTLGSDSEVRTDICKDCFFFNPASQQCLGPGGGVDTPASFLLTSLPFEPDPMTSRLSEVGFRCARSP
jgi:hypothetical protein